jgi:SAM-dependent methyltransferase
MRFSDRAAHYSASRPAYGDDALDFILADTKRPLAVADVGAGTGISARLLAARGADVAAIEPNAAMRSHAQPFIGVTYRDATAEATGLADASVDLVTAFQAFHWFATDAALAEFGRIIRPGGRAALILNERDERDPFTAAYGALYRRYALDDTEQRRIDSIGMFKRLPGHIKEREFAYLQSLDRDGFWCRTASSSYLPQSGAAADALRADLDALFARSSAYGVVRVVLRTIVVRIDLDRAV